MAGDLTFAAGETVKTVTTIWTLNDGAPEPDETFQFHLSHPTNVPISRATSTATIFNDDTALTDVAPNVLGDDGPTTVTLRGTGPDEPVDRVAAPRRAAGHPPASATSPSDDGLSATAVFDTTGATPLDGNWYVEARIYQFSGGYKFVNLQHATADARPFVQASGAGVRARRAADLRLPQLRQPRRARRRSPAFLRLSGYPTGADLAVDHLPPGATRDAARRRRRADRRRLARADPRQGQRLHPRPLHRRRRRSPGHTKLRCRRR